MFEEEISPANYYLQRGIDSIIRRTNQERMKLELKWKQQQEQ